MSLIRKSTDKVDATYLSRNDKVMHYLQNSRRSPAINSITILPKPSPTESYSFLHRLRSCSENDSISTSSSSSSAIDDSLRSNSHTQSSSSDPSRNCSITSSNVSSSSADEDFDFNIGFDQIIPNDDDCDDDNNQQMANRNNADAVTLLGEVGLDARLNEFDEFFRQSSDATILNDEYDLDNDETIASSYSKQQQKRPTFLHDSTNTLCLEDRFSSYTEDNDDDNDDDNEENDQIAGISIRSNSMSALTLDEKSTRLEKAPKKIVRFADVMGLDLESIRYMSPPDQTAAAAIQECLRFQLGQLRLGKSPFDLPTLSRRSATPSSKQYNLVSKHFTSRTNIIPLIYDKQVLLECLYTKDSSAYGTIRVHNCAYEKRVFIRLTQDEWQTWTDIEALHSMHYSHDNTDTFTFEIILPKTNQDTITPKRILFAVCLQAMWQEFWDNNQEQNYVLDVLEKR